MKIIQIDFLDGDLNPQSYKVGVYWKEIREHAAKGEGDKFYYDVMSNDESKIERIFNPSRVIFG